MKNMFCLSTFITALYHTCNNTESCPTTQVWSNRGAIIYNSLWLILSLSINFVVHIMWNFILNSRIYSNEFHTRDDKALVNLLRIRLCVAHKNKYYTKACHKKKRKTFHKIYQKNFRWQLTIQLHKKIVNLSVLCWRNFDINN